MNEKPKIAGIDVSRGSVTVAIVEQLPDQRLKDFVRQHKTKKFTSVEVESLLALDFDGAILEPTGGHYSKFWAAKIEQSGRPVKWVGHQEVHGYRASWKLLDKTDRTDAIALACYGLERWNMPGMFLESRDDLALQLREKHLQIQFLNRANVPYINRLRQQLHWECPELAERKAERGWLRNPPGIWEAIAGNPSAKWDAEIKGSIGLGLSAFSRDLATHILRNERAILRVEVELERLLQSEPLAPYMRALEPFYFGPRTSVAILSAIYPVERYFERRNGLGSFKLACGMAQTWVESGDFKGWMPGGDTNIRKALWLWCFVIVPQSKVTSPELEALRDYYNNGSDQLIKENGVEVLKHFDRGKGNQRIMRTARRAITMLYRRLKAEMS